MFSNPLLRAVELFLSSQRHSRLAGDAAHQNVKGGEAANQLELRERACRLVSTYYLSPAPDRQRSLSRSAVTSSRCIPSLDPAAVRRIGSRKTCVVGSFATSCACPLASSRPQHLPPPYLVPQRMFFEACAITAYSAPLRPPEASVSPRQEGGKDIQPFPASSSSVSCVAWPETLRNSLRRQSLGESGHASSITGVRCSFPHRRPFAFVVWQRAGCRLPRPRTGGRSTNNTKVKVGPFWGIQSAPPVLKSTFCWAKSLYLTFRGGSWPSQQRG